MSSQPLATSVAPVIDIPSKPQFEALITSEQIDIIEKVLAEHRRTRRLMLLFLSFDSETFIEKAEAIINNNEDIYMEAIEALVGVLTEKDFENEQNARIAASGWIGANKT